MGSKDSLTAQNGLIVMEVSLNFALLPSIENFTPN